VTNKTRYESYKAEAAIAGGLIVKHGTADGTCALATAATDLLIGATEAAPNTDRAIGEMAEVHVGEFGEVRLGAGVTRGAALTANAASKAITTTTAGNRIIGYAEQSGALDDLIKFRVAPGVY